MYGGSELNEVILDNIKFGYNRESKDFFVKITRGDIENKYPKENYEIKTKQVSSVEEKVKTIQEDEYKKNSSKEPTSELNEVILDNIKFGYNRESKDFFVLS